MDRLLRNSRNSKVRNEVLVVALLVASNANEIMVGSGRVCFWQESGSQFCIGAFGRNLSSVTVKMFDISFT